MYTPKNRLRDVRADGLEKALPDTRKEAMPVKTKKSLISLEEVLHICEVVRRQKLSRRKRDERDETLLDRYRSPLITHF
jgi:hypothetical protein